MTMWRSKLGQQYVLEDIKKMDSERHQTLKRLRKQPGNDRCAECGAYDTTWASVNVGVFVCGDNCADLHRALGTHISKVKGCGGTYLWGPDEIAQMERLGNRGTGRSQDLLDRSWSKEQQLRFLREKYDGKSVEKAPSASTVAATTMKPQTEVALTVEPVGSKLTVRQSCPQRSMGLKHAPGEDREAAAKQQAAPSRSLDGFLDVCLTTTPAVACSLRMEQARPAPKPIAVRLSADDFDFDEFFSKQLEPEPGIPVVHQPEISAGLKREAEPHETVVPCLPIQGMPVPSLSTVSLPIAQAKRVEDAGGFVKLNTEAFFEEFFGAQTPTAAAA